MAIHLMSDLVLFVSLIKTFKLNSVNTNSLEFSAFIELQKEW